MIYKNLLYFLFMTKCFSYSPNLSGSWKIKNNARGIFLQNDNIINFDNKQNNKLIIKRPLFLGINHDFIHGTYKINNFDITINFNFQNITEEYKYNFDDMTKELCLFDNSKFPHMLLNLDKPKIYLIKNNKKYSNDSLIIMIILLINFGFNLYILFIYQKFIQLIFTNINHF